MPLTTFGSSPSKKACAKSTYSVMTTRDGTSLAHQHLVGAGAQDGAQDRIDAVEPPAFGELLVDQRVDTALLAHHALDEVAEEGGLGIAILAAFDLLAEPMRLELGDHIVEVDAGHVHLVERLDGGESRRAPR